MVDTTDKNYHHEGDNLPSHGEAEEGSVERSTINTYWHANLRLLAILLSIWFVVSFGFGILLVDLLNQVPLFGFKLGFWFAQQGSILCFVVLIFVYSYLIGRIEDRYHLDD